jgi:hypothetical protein
MPGLLSDWMSHAWVAVITIELGWRVTSQGGLCGLYNYSVSVE